MQWRRPIIRDGEPSVRSFPLGLFHHVDVFWNARIAVPEFHHILDERNNIGGLETTAAGGDFIKEVAQGYFVVES